jgi:hypothetical protein
MRYRAKKTDKSFPLKLTSRGGKTKLKTEIIPVQKSHFAAFASPRARLYQHNITI